MKPWRGRFVFSQRELRTAYVRLLTQAELLPAWLSAKSTQAIRTAYPRGAGLLSQKITSVTLIQSSHTTSNFTDYFTHYLKSIYLKIRVCGCAGTIWLVIWESVILQFRLHVTPTSRTISVCADKRLVSLKICGEIRICECSLGDTQRSFLRSTQRVQTW